MSRTYLIEESEKNDKSDSFHAISQFLPNSQTLLQHFYTAECDF